MAWSFGEQGSLHSLFRKSGKTLWRIWNVNKNGWISMYRQEKHAPVEEIEARMAWTLWTMILSLGNNEEFSFPMLVNTRSH